MLDALFAKLQTATDPMAIQSLEAAIWEQWTMVPDPNQRQLMLRGIAEMQQQELQSAAATFSKLIEVAPDLSEAWNKRAHDTGDRFEREGLAGLTSGSR